MINEETKPREEKYNCPCCGKELVKLDYQVECSSYLGWETSDVYECLSCLQKVAFL
jgi:C4-type Zn-finger protein